MHKTANGQETQIERYSRIRREILRKAKEQQKKLPDLSPRWYEPYADYRTYVDALNRGAHAPLMAIKALKDGAYPIVRLGARQFSLFGALPGVDRKIDAGMARANKFIDDNVFDAAGGWLDRNMHNKGTLDIYNKSHVEGATNFAAQLWGAGKLGRALGLGDGTVANYFRFKYSPEYFNGTADAIRERRFGDAAINGLFGTVFSGLPVFGRLGRATQASLASKHPVMAKALGVAMFPVRRSQETLGALAIGGGGYEKLMSILRNNRDKAMRNIEALKSTEAYSKFEKNQNLMAALGIGALGVYGLNKVLGSGKKKKEEEAES